MADVTEGGMPTAGGQLSGEATRAAAVKRMKKEEEFKPKKSGGVPGGSYGGPSMK